MAQAAAALLSPLVFLENPLASWQVTNPHHNTPTPRGPSSHHPLQWGVVVTNVLAALPVPRYAPLKLCSESDDL